MVWCASAGCFVLRPCKAGTFSNGVGSKECYPCGLYQESGDKASYCYCAPGSHKLNSRCQVCPESFTCDGGDTKPFCASGYIAMDDTGAPQRCMSTEDLPAGAQSIDQALSYEYRARQDKQVATGR